jgi:hypothetical protein
MDPYNDPPSHAFKAKKLSDVTSLPKDINIKESIVSNIDGLLQECSESEVRK